MKTPSLDLKRDFKRFISTKRFLSINILLYPVNRSVFGEYLLNIKTKSGDFFKSSFFEIKKSNITKIYSIIKAYNKTNFLNITYQKERFEMRDYSFPLGNNIKDLSENSNSYFVNIGKQFFDISNIYISEHKILIFNTAGELNFNEIYNSKEKLNVSFLGYIILGFPIENKKLLEIRMKNETVYYDFNLTKENSVLLFGYHNTIEKIKFYDAFAFLVFNAFDDEYPRRTGHIEPFKFTDIEVLMHKKERYQIYRFYKRRKHKIVKTGKRMAYWVTMKASDENLAEKNYLNPQFLIGIDRVFFHAFNRKDVFINMYLVPVGYNEYFYTKKPYLNIERNFSKSIKQDTERYKLSDLIFVNNKTEAARYYCGKYFVKYIDGTEEYNVTYEVVGRNSEFFKVKRFVYYILVVD